ncbi:MAG: glycosyltransferase family 39 protein [Sulfuricurvum sp.]|jgi:4-amino-4-deoxy-L-arabinose transferase-like glycosyltransferase
MSNKNIFWLIAFFTAIRLIVAPSFGLGVDEAHYVLYGYYLDLSYVDHPPLVGWVQAAMLYLFGDGVLTARIPAIALMAIISWQCYRFLLFINATQKQALWATAALNSSFMFGAIGLMLLPENFLLVLIFPIMMSVLQIEKKGRIRDFLLLGLLLGLAGLAKYTAVLLVLPLLLYILVKKRYDLLINLRILLTVSIGFVMILPVLLWNASHDWISFTYQSAHVTGNSSLDFKSFIRSTIAQFAAYNPFLFALAFYGLVASFRSKNSSLILAAWVGLSIELFFIGTSFLKPVLPHWPALFYCLFIPIGTILLMQSSPKRASITRGIIIFSLFLSALIHAELYGKWGSFPDYKSPFRDIYGFELQTRQGAQLLEQLDAPKKALAVMNWSYGSRLNYYSKPYSIKTFVLDDYNLQFALWENESPIGYDLIVLHSHFNDENELSSIRCDSQQLLSRTDILLNNRKVDTVEFIQCTNYQGKK